MKILFKWIDMFLIGIFLVAFTQGCVTSAGTEVTKEGATYNVTVNSLILDNYIKITERSTRRVNGLLEAQIRGQNISRKDVQAEYRFVWLDKDGIKLDSGISVWKPLSLHAKESAFMQGIASTPEAVDFLMTVRFAHPSTRW